jgi:uncharacterized membrane protein
MKTRNLLFPLALIVIAVIFQSSILFNGNSSIAGDVNIPEDVKSVLDNKCYGCHNMEAKSDKAKDKLLLDKLGDLSKAKLIAKLGDIGEVAGEGAMPPEKFLEQKPEKKLTEEEQKLLVDWAENTADELLN